MELYCFTLIRSYFSFLWKFMLLLLFIFEYGYILYNLFSSAYLFWFLQYLLFIHLFSKHWVNSIWQVPFLNIEQLTVNVKESVFKELTIWVFITLSVYQLVNYCSVPILECKHLEERLSHIHSWIPLCSSEYALHSMYYNIYLMNGRFPVI